jgi:hypothetical protein
LLQLLAKEKIIAKKQYQFLAITALIFLDTLQLLDPKYPSLVIEVGSVKSRDP